MIRLAFFPRVGLFIYALHQIGISISMAGMVGWFIPIAYHPFQGWDFLFPLSIKISTWR